MIGGTLTAEGTFVFSCLWRFFYYWVAYICSFVKLFYVAKICGGPSMRPVVQLSLKFTITMCVLSLSLCE